ncbi:sulfofructose kinase [Jannaschia pagri]|uniref:Sulfofructose kinase n=1 Tax=Jannaschia pagri TaxID=2829797 RepID=A0ABQ4NKP9_9RHOB|nr:MULTISPECIES: PfkB family carbohydrate kinase [unclassified Jannaschia]GIT91137.1 sulfofructose kinase [Jannaschia sp. AI_61]GIT94969.1 sulfofructose kinase [Jannaschia sp. AI_62]
MTRLVVAGIAVMDYVQRVAALPVGEGKHRSTSFERIGGGCAANAAVGAARLGAEVTLITRLGVDATGDELAAMLMARGVRPAFARGGRTPLSSVMVDPAGERMIVNFPGDGLPSDPPAVPPCDAALVDCRWPEAAEAVLRAAQHAAVPGVLDGEKYTPDPLAALATHVVFSAPGLRDFSGIDALPKALAEAAKRLPGLVAYTNGPDGVHWAHGPQIAAVPVTAVDTLGAGDLWHGAFALALGRGRDLIAASTFANRAAALKCTRAGGWDAYPTDTELETP